MNPHIPPNAECTGISFLMALSSVISATAETTTKTVAVKRKSTLFVKMTFIFCDFVLSFIFPGKRLQSVVLAKSQVSFVELSFWISPKHHHKELSWPAALSENKTTRPCKQWKCVIISKCFKQRLSTCFFFCGRKTSRHVLKALGIHSIDEINKTVFDLGENCTEELSWRVKRGNKVRIKIKKIQTLPCIHKGEKLWHQGASWIYFLMLV